jgi:hypothetical protein
MEERMNVVHCTERTPWGIHAALRDHSCSRCGWTVPRDAAASPVAVAADDAEVTVWQVASLGFTSSARAAAA